MSQQDDNTDAAEDRPIEERLQVALEERDENHKNWQRALADYQNLRRRLASDTEDAVKRGKKTLVTDLLLVLDYLDMALAAPATNDETRALRAGIDMTRQQLWAALQREGVALVRETGAFDATWHDCAERIETQDAPEGAILSVMRKGYAWNGTVLRPAQVRVAATPAGSSTQRGTGA